MKARAELIALLVTLSVAYVFAADWPAYLGPRRDGTSVEKGLLRTWPKEGPKVLRILDAIKDEEKRPRSTLSPLREDFPEVSIGYFFDETNDILMKAALRHLIEGFLWCKSDGDLSLGGEIENGLDRGMQFFGSNQNFFKTKVRGFQSFLNGMNAVDNLRHKYQSSKFKVNPKLKL